jgi:hypothetical protein
MRPVHIALVLVTVSGCGSDGIPAAQSQGGAPTSPEGGGSSTSGSSTGASSSGGSSSGGSSSGASSSSGGGSSNGGASAGSSSSTGGKNDAATGGQTMTGAGAMDCGPAVTANAMGALSATEFTNVSPSKAKLGVAGDDHVFTQGIAVDPNTPGTVYVTVSGFNSANFSVIPGGICRTTDGGNTWAPVGKLQQPLAIRINPKDSKHMYAGDGVRGDTMGFWVTTDGGETWTSPKGFVDVAKSFNSADIYHIEPNPEDFNHVLVSFHGAWNDCRDFGFGGCTSGIIESVDGGANWTVHDPEPGWAGRGGYAVFMLYSPELKIGDSKTWLVGSQGAGFWRTADGGKTWKQVTKVSMSHGGAQVYRAKNGDLFLGAELTPLTSKDNGETWTEINDKNGVPSGYYFSLFGDGTRMYTSSNGTNNKFISALESAPLSWSPFGAQAFTASVFEMAIDKQNGVLYASTWESGVLAVKAAK